ncbi:MAG: hypothetical protein AUJ71_04580 [Candidatus Omnitrophica bacterium CG1_02_49_16]|nr:MAG: hypothetical protein AUJ71_04580 [Candidatus Omnitrophica bacterium CG1_02_49_16]
MTEHSFISFDETPIHYCLLKTAGTPKAIVIFIHGLGEYGKRYSAFGEYLNGLGIDSYFPDLRGFGQSGGRRACVRSFSDFHEDLYAFHSWISRNHKGVPVFLLGHSFGGLVASSYLSLRKHPPAAGVVLSSPLFGIAISVPLLRHWIALLASTLCPDLTEANGVDPFLLTHDAEILSAYGKDPLIFHRISARLYREIHIMMRKKNAIAGNLKDPVLLLQAGEDHIVSKAQSLKFFSQIAAKDKELEVYDGFYHEILNESRRAIVYARIGAWLLKKSV